MNNYNERQVRANVPDFSVRFFISRYVLRIFSVAGYTAKPYF